MTRLVPMFLGQTPGVSMNRLKLFAASVVVAAGIAVATAALADRNVPDANLAAERRGPQVYETTSPVRSGPRWEYARFRYTPLQEDWSWRSGTLKVTGNASRIYHSFAPPPRTADGDIWFGEVLSLAGQQGWEIVQLNDHESGSEVWLKRAAQ
jgi:hypothetical protein